MFIFRMMYTSNYNSLFLYAVTLFSAEEIIY